MFSGPNLICMGRTNGMCSGKILKLNLSLLSNNIPYGPWISALYVSMEFKQVYYMDIQAYSVDQTPQTPTEENSISIKPRILLLDIDM